MSEPIRNEESEKTVTGKLLAAVGELINAISSLNMEPCPIDPSKELNYPSNAFLSNTDHWVKHSMVHIREAMDLIMKAKEKL